MELRNIGIEGRVATTEMRGQGKEEIVRVWERRAGVKGGWMMIHYSLRKSSV